MYTAVFHELLTAAPSGKAAQQTLRIIERVIADPVALPFPRVHVWWVLLQRQGVPRFSDHRISVVCVRDYGSSLKLSASRSFGVQGCNLEFVISHVTQLTLTHPARKSLQPDTKLRHQYRDG